MLKSIQFIVSMRIRIKRLPLKTPVTVTDVARRANVSTSTVSLVVNGQFHRVSSETREKIEVIIQELGYTPNRIARYLRRQDTQTIGVITAGISHSVFGDIVEAIEEITVETGYQVLIARAENASKEPAVVKAMVSSQVSGVIFVSHSERMNNGAMETLTKAGIPFVCVNRWLENEDYNRVYWDNRQGIREAVAHLAGKGHRRIAYLGDMSENVSLRQVERRDGYLEEMNLRQFPTEGLVHNAGYLQTTQIIQKLLGLPLNQRPTAIVLEDDIMATGVYSVARAANIRIPEDLAVIGFSDREFAAYLTPSLTTVSLPVRDTGRLSASTLLQLLAEGPNSNRAPVNLRSSCYLVFRRSCGCTFN
jgi:DNA-binding LacI/PurR family transcriptional regulator